MYLLVCFLLFAAIGCASTTAEFLEENPGYRVTPGYVIRLENLNDPKVQNLKDGTAYTATQKGAFLIMEQKNPSPFPGRRRPRRIRIDLAPGDIFVKSRPLSFALQARKAASAPPR